MPNDHTTAIVPLQTWAYESPRLGRQGATIDIGLIAEALIYYDRVLIVPFSEVNVATVITPGVPQFTDPTVSAVPRRTSFMEFVDWFAQRGHYADLIALFSEGSLGIYHYAFQTLPILKDGVYMCWNCEDEEEQNRPTFMRRVAGHRDLEGIIPRARQRERLYRALERSLTEVHARDFNRAVENARIDFVDARTAGLAVQGLIDDIRDLMPSGSPARIDATSKGTPSGGTNLTFNIDFGLLTRALIPVRFGVATPLCGLAHSNRLLWAAAMAHNDLYLPSPVSRLVSEKLIETNDRRMRTHDLIEQLEASVDFPDVRSLVNSGALCFEDVLKIRGKARRFRDWLQLQADRDRDAILAYHHEVAQASGFSRAAGRTLRLFGVLAGAGAGAYVGSTLAGPTGAALGGGAGALVEEGVRFVFDMAGRLDEDWRPVVFGDWLHHYAEGRQ